MAGGAFSGTSSADDLPEPGGPFAGSRAAILQTFSEEILVRLIWPDDEGIELVNGFPTRRRNGGGLEDGDVFFRTSIDSLYFYNLATTTWERQTTVADVEFYQTSPTMPSTRPDGSALQEGDIWFDSTNDDLYIYNGTAYEELMGANVQQVQIFFTASFNSCLLYTSPSPRDS